MKHLPFIATTLFALVCLTVLIAPLMHANGMFWTLAVLVSIVVYYGLQVRWVYCGLGLLVVLEVVYGFPVGVLSISYALVVGLLLVTQRFLSLTPWSQQEGWSLSDGLRSVSVSWLLCGGVLLFSVPVGTLLYGFGAPLVRLQSLGDAEVFIVLLLLCVVTTILIRRMTIPFRRAILFGL